MALALIITDSGGAPRGVPLRIVWPETWVAMVARQLVGRGWESYPFIERSMDSAGLLLRARTLLQFMEPDLLILQIGVPDMVTRPATKLNQWLYHKAKGQRWAKALLARRGGHVPAIPADRFGENMEAFRACFPGCPALVLPIVVCEHHEFAEMARWQAKAAPLYNDRLRKTFSGGKDYFLAEYLTARQNAPGRYTTDRYHLDHEGHRLVAGMVTEALSRHFGI